MLTLGIDPGYAIIGWGLIDYSGARLTPVAFGAVTTEAGVDFPKRLLKISNSIGEILDKFRPQAVSIEKLYFKVLWPSSNQFDVNNNSLVIYSKLFNVTYLFTGDIEKDAEIKFFNSNTTTAIDVAQARGVIVTEAARRNIDIFEYTPLQVKQAVVGYGRAEKKQVMEMTRQLLKLQSVPKPDDTADALAVAICHAHSFHSQSYELLKRTKA